MKIVRLKSIAQFLAECAAREVVRAIVREFFSLVKETLLPRG